MAEPAYPVPPKIAIVVIEPPNPVAGRATCLARLHAHSRIIFQQAAGRRIHGDD
jgi:hypothetical protein